MESSLVKRPKSGQGLAGPYPPRRDAGGGFPSNSTVSTFKELGIPSDLIQGLEELGIVTQTEVQEKAIPFLMEDGGDLIAVRHHSLLLRVLPDRRADRASDEAAEGHAVEEAALLSTHIEERR